MYTYEGSGTAGTALTLFDTAHMVDNNFGGTGTSCGTSCNLVVGFFRGDPTYNLENWKLGDLFHTNPVVVSSPSVYFMIRGNADRPLLIHSATITNGKLPTRTRL